MWQISDESTSAFTKANNNMSRIQLKVEQVPGYVEDCMEYLKSEHKEGIKKLLHRRPDQTKEMADDVATLKRSMRCF
jgi:hypothetical protein